MTSDGGYAETDDRRGTRTGPHTVDELKSEDAAPLVCAGITTFNALRNADRADDTVAIQGIGGLGHLGVQYAKKMGFRTVCNSASSRQRTSCAQTGRPRFPIDAKAEDAGARTARNWEAPT